MDEFMSADPKISLAQKWKIEWVEWSGGAENKTGSPKSRKTNNAAHQHQRLMGLLFASKTGKLEGIGMVWVWYG